MVQGVMVCETFVTKKTLIIFAVITVLLLVLGCNLVGFGVSTDCYYKDHDNYYDYNDYCMRVRLSFITYGGVLISLSVITLVTVSVLLYRLREAPTHPTPTTAAQPYVMPGHAVVMPQTAIVYNQANPVYPQQHLPAAATTSESSSHHLQQPPTTSPNPSSTHTTSETYPRTTTTTTCRPLPHHKLHA